MMAIMMTIMIVKNMKSMITNTKYSVTVMMTMTTMLS